MRKNFFKVSAIIALLSSGNVRADAADRQPNVIVILADDLGFGDVSAYGQTTINTLISTHWLVAVYASITAMPRRPLQLQAVMP